MLTTHTRWDKATHDAAQADSKAQQDAHAPEAKQAPPKDRESMAEQAKLLLRGEEPWKPKADQWVDDGEAREVEQDVMLPPPAQ